MPSPKARPGRGGLGAARPRQEFGAGARAGARRCDAVLLIDGRCHVAAGPRRRLTRHPCHYLWNINPVCVRSVCVQSGWSGRPQPKCCGRCMDAWHPRPAHQVLPQPFVLAWSHPLMTPDLRPVAQLPPHPSHRTAPLHLAVWRGAVRRGAAVIRWRPAACVAWVAADPTLCCTPRRRHQGGATRRRTAHRQAGPPGQPAGRRWEGGRWRGMGRERGSGKANRREGAPGGERRMRTAGHVHPLRGLGGCRL